MKQTETNEIKVISKKLDDACFIDFGTRVVQKKDGGAIFPVYGGGGATFKMDSYNRENCLVVSRFAMSKQCTRFVEGKFYLNDSGLTVRPKNEKELSQEYLDYLLLTLNDTIYSLSRGTAQRNLNVPKFRKLEIKYPDSIELQLHIAYLLNKAENLIAKRKESIRLLDEYLKSTFLEMFGECTKNEKNWNKIELKYFGDIITGNTPPRNNYENYSSNFIEWIKTDNIPVDDTYITKAAEYLSESGLRYARTVESGALLVACIAGSIQSVGRAALTNRKVSFNQQINAIQPNEEIEPLYLYWLFKISRKYIQDAASNGMKKILTKGGFEKIKMIKPPIELQTQFAQIVEKTEALKTQYQQSLQELDDLYGSLSQRAFRGEITIKDESLLMAAEPKSSYVAQSNIPDNKRGFAKQVLGGKIVSLFKDDNNFTHIKFQKLQYLAEQIAEENLLWNYYRQAAGPHDNKFKYSVIAKLNENKWFEERNYMFYPLQKANDVDRYYKNYFGNKSDRLNELFLLLKNATEKFCGAIATIYAVWNNQIILQLPYNKSEIKKAFFEWSNRKEIIFTEDEFEKALEWMKKHNIEPIGFGQLIKERTGKK